MLEPAVKARQSYDETINVMSVFAWFPTQIRLKYQLFINKGRFKATNQNGWVLISSSLKDACATSYLLISESRIFDFCSTKRLSIAE